MELARGQQAILDTVVLVQPRENNGSDRQVHADAQRVGARHDLQQPLLGEPFDQPPVPGQHARMVHTDAVSQQARQILAESRREFRLGQLLRDRGLLVIGQLAGHRGDRVRLCGGVGLAEVDDVQRRRTALQQRLDRVVQQGAPVLELQRHGADGIVDDGGRAVGAPGEVLRQGRHVPQRGRQQQKRRLGQMQQRHLPGPATIGVAVEVELVEYHGVDVGVRPVTQRQVGQHLGGGAHNGRPGVER